jgi:hypothetical protein
MEYFEEVLDRKSGELTKVSQGHWIKVSELGQLFGVGRREVRSVLRQMGVLAVEGAASHQRHRLAAWVVHREWGRRIEKKGMVPFDVLGPELRQWMAERWQSTVEAIAADTSSRSLVARAALDRFKVVTGRSNLSAQEEVSWLADFFPELTQVETGMVLNVSQQLVGRFRAIRTKQRSDAIALRAMDLDDRQAMRSSLHGGKER